MIQYAPATEAVQAEPVLVVPAWIMKYYILDLSPHNSLVKYLVEHGHTVFMISWKNPGMEERDLGMEDYHTLGVMEALNAVTAIVPGQKVHGVGYCIGGTLLAIAAAAMARDGDHRLPLFVVSTIKDHVAPWRSVYKIHLLTDTDLTFVLAAGGHNAGIVSEPGHPRRSYQCTHHKEVDRHPDPDTWQAIAPKEEGSWWPAWQAWLAKHSNGLTAPPSMGAPARGYLPLAEAPGVYVLEP